MRYLALCAMPYLPMLHRSMEGHPMKKHLIIATAIVAVVSAGVANAQSPNVHDRTMAAHAAGGPAGTVGAMREITYGIATSAQDVSLQQDGRGTAADGARRLMASPSGSYSPGTTGANPGGDMSAVGRR